MTVERRKRRIDCSNCPWPYPETCRVCQAEKEEKREVEEKSSSKTSLSTRDFNLFDKSGLKFVVGIEVRSAFAK